MKLIFLNFFLLYICFIYKNNVYLANSLYRSLSCFIVSSLAIYNYFLAQLSIELMYVIFDIFYAYIVTDLLYLFYTKSKRRELYLHHFVCLTQNYINYYMDSRDFYIVNLVYIAELLSILNYSFIDKRRLLKLWRLFIIIFIRIPIWYNLFYYSWIQGIYTENSYFILLLHFVSIIMPIIELTLFYKIVKN